jgi:hypothetical protein
MLVIDVVTEESYDEETNKFVASESVRVELEHSLVSLSKWESIHEKRFLSPEPRTDEETISYIKAMIVGDEPSPAVFYQLLLNHMEEIKTYVAAKNTATVLPSRKQNQGQREAITSELIYYWMSELNIPVEYQHWHLNKLFTLIQVHALKKGPKQKMSLEQRRALNKQRKREWNTTG